MIFPWHMLVPSVAVAGHWYLAAGPSKPFNDVFEVVRNVTGMDRGLPQECWKDNEAACKQSHYDDLMAELMDRIQTKRTVYDRWGTLLIASTFCAIPFIVVLSLCLPRLMSWNLLRAAAHHSHLLEVVGYSLSLVCGAIGKNLDMPSAGPLWGRSAAVLFVASHIVFGTLRQRDDASERFWLEWLRACNEALSPGFFSASMHTLVWAAATVVHQDAFCGFLTMMASLCSFLWLWSELDPMIAEVRATELAELDALQLMWTFSRRLATAAAVMTIVSQAAFRQLQYMTFGAMYCGHNAGLAAMLMLSLGQSRTSSSFGRQAAVLGTFCCSILLGLLLDAPSLASGGASALLLWFWVKCLEAPWANPLFKAFITVALVQLLRQHPGMLREIANPKNLYAEGG